MKIPLILPCLVLLSLCLSCNQDASDLNCGEFHCENNGTCIQYACQCTLAYTGLYCDEEKVPCQTSTNARTVTNKISFGLWGRNLCLGESGYWE